MSETSVIESAAPTTTSTTSWQVERQDGIVFIQRQYAAAPEPGDWRQRMRNLLATGHGVAAVGAKRLNEQGRLFAMGEFVVHPKGFHHQGQGVLPQAYRFPEEVDAIAGGVLAVEADAFDAVDGPNALSGELGMLELCLRLRRRGRRCLALPQVVVQDSFSPQPSPQEAAAFARRWQFDWLAPDLAAVRQHHAGTGLLWNPRLHSPSMPFDKYVSRPAVHWTNYEKVEVYRQRADHIIAFFQQHVPGGPVLDVGCGDGLFTHLIARHGLEAVGMDPEAVAIEQARQQVARQSYPGPTPRFEVAPGEALPCEDGRFGAVMMLDVIEHLPNPAAVLGEVRRALAPGGALLLTTPAWQYAGWSDPFYHVTEYTPDELARQVEAVGFKVAQVGRIGGVYRDIVMLAQRRG